MTHVAPDSFGDLDVAASDPHVAACAQCRAELSAQQQVREVLAGLPSPGQFPDDVSARVMAALAALPPLSVTVVPLDAARARRRPRRGWLAAAAAVVALGAGGYVVHELAPEGRSASTAGAAMEPRSSRAAGGAPALGASVVRSSGTRYTRAGLATQVDGVRHRQGTLRAAGGTVASPAAVSQCLQAIEAGAATVLLADAAFFEGQPSLVLLLRTPDGLREVWVVDRSCRRGQDGLRYFQRLG